MKGLALSLLTALLLAQIAPAICEAASATSNGPAALALAAVVGAESSLISPVDKQVLANLFDGNPDSFPSNQRIIVKADSMVCRASDVDISERRCELTFGTHKRTLTGREANELNATAIQAGIPPEGTAGTIFESVAHLICLIEPGKIKQRDGSGASCTFTPEP